MQYKELIDRIRRRAGLGALEEAGVEKLEDAVAHARAVMGVLEEAVSGGEMEDVRRQFPSEFDPLFESGSGPS